MDFLSETWDLFINLVAIACIAIVYIVGGFVCKLISGAAKKLYEKFPRTNDPFIVMLIINGIIVAISAVLCTINGIGVQELINSVFPFASFKEVTEQFSGDGGGFVVNTIIETVGYQLSLSALNFVPFFIFEFVAVCICTFICHEDEDPSILRKLVYFLMGFASALAVNGIVMCTGTLFAEKCYNIILELQFQFEIGFGGNIVILIIWFIVALFMITQIVISTFRSDTVLAFIGVNIFATISGLELIRKYTVLLFVIAMVCGCVSKLVRSRVTSDEENGYITDIVVGLGNMVITALVGWGIFELFGLLK